MKQRKYDLGTRQKVRDLLSQGKTSKEISIELGYSKAAISYHVSNIKAEDGEFTKGNRHDYALIQKLVDSGMSTIDVRRRLGLSKDVMTRGFASGKLQNNPSRRNVSITSYIESFSGISLTSCQAKRIKERLVTEMGWLWQCSWCKNHEWNGKPIPLALDHIDGDPTHNAIKNYRFLCLNCHSQTETYGWRNVLRKRGGISVPRTGFEPALACVKDRSTSHIRPGGSDSTFQ